MTPGVRRLTIAVSRGSRSTTGLVTEIERSVRRLTPTPPLRPREKPYGPSPADAWRAFEDADLWSCTYCDVPLGGMVVGEVDHVVPLASGGVHDFYNMAPSCRPCNNAKSARPVEVWLSKVAGQSPT